MVLVLIRTLLLPYPTHIQWKWKVGGRNVSDPILQGSAVTAGSGDGMFTINTAQSGSTSFNIGNGFEGISNADQGDGVYPPDPNVAVGPTHVVEMVNVMWAVYNKDDGTQLYGPMYSNALFAGMDSPCATFRNTGQ
jgi:hypothetical protein